MYSRRASSSAARALSHMASIVRKTANMAMPAPVAVHLPLTTDLLPAPVNCAAAGEVVEGREMLYRAHMLLK